MTQLETQQWVQETAAVLEQARRAITDSTAEPVLQLAERLPAGPISSDDAPISLAFAGQFNAGKSTIIKALTGRDDIVIKAEIATLAAHSYDWNGVTIIDTPGIHAGVRPDHDAISYQTLSEADLLVFVVPNDLFDNHIAEHYRKLTIDRGKGHETMLVVNKMGRNADGNTPEAQAIKTEDLRAPLDPFTPEQLRITFIDALSALEALDESDPEFREDLEREANLEALIANLNELVREKGLTARHTNVLYTIDQVLQDAIRLEPTDDLDADALALIYNQNIRAITDAKQQLSLATSTIIEEGRAEIRNAGADLAEHFYPDVGKSEMERAEGHAANRIEEISQRIAARTEQVAGEILPQLGQSLSDLRDSGLHQDTFNNIKARQQGRNLGRAINAAAFGADKLGDLAGNLALNSGAVARGASGLAQYSGSVAHGAILNVGHFLGHSFRPWQAVKMASWIGRAAPFLSIAGAVLSVGAQIYADRREDKQSREMDKIRQDIRSRFTTISIEIGDQFTSEWQKIIKEMLDDPLQQITQQRGELNALRQQQNAHLEHLNAASAAVNDLIRRIHAA